MKTSVDDDERDRIAPYILGSPHSQQYEVTVCVFSRRFCILGISSYKV